MSFIVSVCVFCCHANRFKLLELPHECIDFTNYVYCIDTLLEYAFHKNALFLQIMCTVLTHCAVRLPQ